MTKRSTVPKSSLEMLLLALGSRPPVRTRRGPSDFRRPSDEDRPNPRRHGRIKGGRNPYRS